MSLERLLKEIRLRADRQTPQASIYFGQNKNILSNAKVTGMHAAFNTYTDGEFYYHAKADIPRLLAVISKLREQRNYYIDLYWEHSPGIHEENDKELEAILNGGVYNYTLTKEEFMKLVNDLGKSEAPNEKLQKAWEEYQKMSKGEKK